MYAKKEWENIVEEAKNDLSPFDDKIFKAAETLDKKQPAVQRALIEHHPGIARLRNRIESLTNYPKDRNLLSRALRPDVVRLMAMRTHRAQMLGREDYLDFVLDTAGISFDRMEGLLEETLGKYLPQAQRLAKEKGLDWENWFKRLKDAYPLEKEPDAEAIVKAVEEYFKGQDWNRSLTIHIFEKGLAGFARKFPDGSVHVKIRPLTNAFSLKTFIHELSHAGLYLESDPDHPKNFITPPTDEFLAAHIEDALINKICTQTEKEVIREIRTLELVRIILSAQFELDLWKRRGIPEERYRIRHEKLLPVLDDKIWTLDTFRSVDSLLIMFYALGQASRDCPREEPDVKKARIPADPAGVRIADYFGAVN